MKNLLLLAALGVAGVCIYKKVKGDCACKAVRPATQPGAATTIADVSDYIATCEERMSGNAFDLANEFEIDA